MSKVDHQSKVLPKMYQTFKRYFTFVIVSGLLESTN